MGETRAIKEDREEHDDSYARGEADRRSPSGVAGED